DDTEHRRVDTDAECHRDDNHDSEYGCAGDSAQRDLQVHHVTAPLQKDGRSANLLTAHVPIPESHLGSHRWDILIRACRALDVLHGVYRHCGTLLFQFETEFVQHGAACGDVIEAHGRRARG